MKALVHILEEILILVIVIAVSGTAVFFVVKNIKADRNYDIFTGSVQKRELRIVSPVFGNIEEFPVTDGQLVKKGDVVATIRIFGASKDKPDVDSSTFSVQGTELKVISPEDSIVAKKLFSEKSVVKPGVDFLVLYPLKDAMVKIDNAQNGPDILAYKALVVTESGKDYPLKLLKTLPVDEDKGNQNTFYAVFSDVSSSENFYNGEDVTIRADKAGVGEAQELQPLETITPLPSFSPSPINSNSTVLTPSPTAKSELVATPTP